MPAEETIPLDGLVGAGQTKRHRRDSKPAKTGGGGGGSRSNKVSPSGGGGGGAGPLPVVITARQANYMRNTNLKMSTLAGKGRHSLYITHLLARNAELYLDIMPGLLFAFMNGFLAIALMGIITLSNVGMGYNTTGVNNTLRAIYAILFLVHVVDLVYAAGCGIRLYVHRRTYTDVYANVTKRTSARLELILYCGLVVSIVVSGLLVFIILACYNGNYCQAIANAGSSAVIVLTWMVLSFWRMGKTVYNLFMHHFLADPYIFSNDIVVTECVRLGTIAKGLPSGDVIRFARAKAPEMLRRLQAECEADAAAARTAIPATTTGAGAAPQAFPPIGRAAAAAAASQS